MKKLLPLFLLIMIFSSVSYADITSNLGARWKFDEGSGTSVTDATGNGHGGTISSSGTWYKANIGAYSIDCNSTPFPITYSSVSISSNTFTIAAWIKPITTGSNYQEFVQDGTGGYLFGLHADKLDLYDGADNVSTTGVTDNVWQHVVAVVSSGSVTYYINGTSAGTASFAHNPAFNNICSNSGGGNPYTGKIDDMRIYNRALTSGDVSELYAYTDPDITTGLAARWDFEEGSGSTTADLTGNSHTGTLHGSTAFTTGKIGVYSTTYNGTTDYITTAGTSPASSAPALTVSAWIKTPDNSNQYMMIEDGTTFTDNAFYFYLHNGQPEVEVTDGSNYDAFEATNLVSNNTWTHMVLVWSPGQIIRLYINGAYVSSGSYTQSGAPLSSLHSSGTAVYLGGRPASPITLAYNGQLDDVRMYTRALNDTDVNTLYSFTDPSSGSVISKINSVPFANVTKVNGVAIGSVKKYEGVAAQ